MKDTNKKEQYGWSEESFSDVVRPNQPQHSFKPKPNQSKAQLLSIPWRLREVAKLQKEKSEANHQQKLLVHEI